MVELLRICAALHCNNNNRNTSLTFFRFPKDVYRLDKWVSAIELKAQTRKDIYLCSDHFGIEAFTNTFKQRLLPGAIPSIQVLDKYTVSSVSKQDSISYVKNKKKNTCCICAASSVTHPYYRFFRIPKDTERAKKWLDAIGKPFLKSRPVESLYKSRRVCSKHFTGDSYKTVNKRYLHDCAVPTRFLNTTSNWKWKKEIKRSDIPQLLVTKKKEDPKKSGISDGNIQITNIVSLSTSLLNDSVTISNHDVNGKSNIQNQTPSKKEKDDKNSRMKQGSLTEVESSSESSSAYLSDSSVSVQSSPSNKKHRKSKETLEKQLLNMQEKHESQMKILTLKEKKIKLQIWKIEQQLSESGFPLSADN